MHLNKRLNMLNNEERYAIFKENRHLSFWNSYESALQEGYEKFGRGTFLVRKISREYEIFGRYGTPHHFCSISA